MLIVCDRVNGLHLFSVDVLVPGYSYVDLISSNIQAKI